MPIPVAEYGLMFVLYTLPNGVSNRAAASIDDAAGVRVADRAIAERG